jgi:hypothetical protein
LLDRERAFRHGAMAGGGHKPGEFPVRDRVDAQAEGAEPLQSRRLPSGMGPAVKTYFFMVFSQ